MALSAMWFRRQFLCYLKQATITTICPPHTRRTARSVRRCCILTVGMKSNASKRASLPNDSNTFIATYMHCTRLLHGYCKLPIESCGYTTPWYPALYIVQQMKRPARFHGLEKGGAQARNQGGGNRPIASPPKFWKACLGVRYNSKSQWFWPSRKYLLVAVLVVEMEKRRTP